MLLPLVLLPLLAGPPAVDQDGCQPPPATRKVLEAIQIPADARLSSGAQNEQQLALVRRALTASPRDVQLHEAYQRLRLNPVDADRAALVREYEALLEKNRRDPVFLYLAARAQLGFRTKDAIAHLEQILALDPSFAPSHLLLAEIYSAAAYEKPDAVARHMDAFAASCPGSVRAFNALPWSKDRELIARVAARLRRNIAARTDSEAVEWYPVLWRLEAAMERSDRQDENRARLAKDIERLYSPAFVRNAAWFSTLDAVWIVDDAQNQTARARKEVAAAFPLSRLALSQRLSELAARPAGATGAEARSASLRRQWKSGLPLVAQYPDSQWLTATLAWAAVWDEDATAAELTEAVTPYVHILRRQPDESNSLPPQSASVAARLVQRGAAYDLAIELALVGLKVADVAASPDRVNDLRGQTAEALTNRRDAWYLFTYYPLGEAYARLGRLAEAKGVLLKYEELLQKRRPASTAPSADKMRFAEDEARFWQLRGIVAEADGHQADALIAYRNALSTYPPRRPGGDRRDEAMRAAETIWRRLGGTTQGWSDWARTNSLVNFNAGAGAEGSAWGRLAAASPGLVFTDVLGNTWRPQDLATKTVFLTMWASWCGPCRAELPYVQKLHERFRGRTDVVVLAMNVDEDPKQMDVALAELKVKVPSVAARDFIYSVVPQMALPSNWILTPSKTEMLLDSSSSLDEWLENTAKAIDKAAAK